MSFKYNQDNLGKLLFFTGAIFLLIATFIGLTYSGLWYDEFYSCFVVQLPFAQFKEIILKDVHPVLYYLILKGFYKIFSFIGFTNIAIIGRIVSLIPFYLLGILSLTKIRKNFGMLTSGIFFLCICSMPQLMLYSVEIRMYSWGLFFVTASFVYCYEIIKDSSFKNWFILTVLTIASAYTHYFSAIASFSLYLMLLIYVIRNKRQLFKNWFISAIVSILAFVPWVFVVLGQVQNIIGNYWIDPITANTIISYIYFVLSPADIFVRANELIQPTIIGTVFLAIFIYLAWRVRDRFALSGLAAVVLVPLIGIIISVLYNPFFHVRYLVPALGCLWLSFSILYSKIFDNKKLFVGILCFILLVGVIGTVDFITIQEQDQIATDNEFNSVNAVLGQNNVLFYNFFPDYVEISSYYAPNNTHVCFDNEAREIVVGYNDPGIQGKIDSGSKVFFISSKKLGDVNGTNLTFTKIDCDLFVKGNIFKIYEVKEM